MEVPEVFIVWWTQNASSNFDLASLSNVNRQWRRIVVQAILEQAQRENVSSTVLLLPSMVRAILNSDATARIHSLQHDEQDTFCAAWFHPAGIQMQQLPIAGDVWDYENETVNGAFAPSGAPFYAGSEEERPRNSPRGRSMLRGRQEGPLCSHEWQGYREPMDVLEPFGYAEHFVQVRGGV